MPLHNIPNKLHDKPRPNKFEVNRTGLRGVVVKSADS